MDSVSPPYAAATLWVAPVPASSESGGDGDGDGDGVGAGAGAGNAATLCDTGVTNNPEARARFPPTPLKEQILDDKFYGLTSSEHDQGLSGCCVLQESTFDVANRVSFVPRRCSVPVLLCYS